MGIIRKLDPTLRMDVIQCTYIRDAIWENLPQVAQSNFAKIQK